MTHFLQLALAISLALSPGGADWRSCCPSPLAAVAALFASPIVAGHITGFADITSNYISRGTAQNVYGKPSLQGGLTYMTVNRFYASTFASTMNDGAGSKKEIDFFAGKKETIKEATIDLSVASVNYPNNRAPIHFVEYDLKLDHPIGRGNAGVWFGYTDHYFQVYGVGYWTEAHASHPLTDRLSVSGSIASQALSNHFDYRTFNVGTTYQLTSHYACDLRYSNTDRHDLDPVFKTYSGQFSATVTASF